MISYGNMLPYFLRVFCPVVADTASLMILEIPMMMYRGYDVSTVVTISPSEWECWFHLHIIW